MSNNDRSKKSSDDIIENITDLKSLFEDLKKESGLKGNNIRKKIELPFDEFLEQENPKKQSSNKKVNLGTQRGNSYDYNKMSEIKNEVEVIKKRKYEPREDLNKNVSRLSKKKVINLWKK